MVSTIICPRCKTKNTKKAEICYNCKNPLKPNKKPAKSNLLTFNPKSRVDIRIIVIGVLLFVLSNVLFLYIVYDYAMLVSGFAIMLFLYIVFKYYSQPDDYSAGIRSIGFKIILYYLVIVLIGAVILLTFHLY
ncbi:MAG: zinc ribbon domain-containing protein [Methanobacterium sp.]|nr:zinc ribbon domain-containing protein [Methanobacterium sp.]